MTTSLHFEDTWDGAAHTHGRWVLTNEMGERRVRHHHRQREDHVFRSDCAITAREVLALARAFDAAIVAVVDDPNEPGWTCLYEHPEPGATMRLWQPEGFAEIT